MFRQKKRLHFHKGITRTTNKNSLKERIINLEHQLRELRELEELRMVDALTGLPNRHRLLDVLQETLVEAGERNRQAAILLMDLDRFKIINETLGHKTGDNLLAAVAKRLSEWTDGDEVICRLGGDEFLVILPHAPTPEAAVIMAKVILEELARPYHMDGFELFITASVGISLYPSDGEDADTLLKNAESAMYKAKNYGNNYQLYNESINASLIWRLALSNRLRRAVANEEFSVVYQPKVNVKTTEIIGMEALVRWHNPEVGPVSPAQFIPIAEELGLIVAIGEWVLYTACEQNKRWRDMGFPPLRIAVNLSARQFQDDNLIDLVQSILLETGLPGTGLTIEVTESLLMTEPEKAIGVLKKMQDLGIEISIDDFGTGYSSLNYLKKFPLNHLKIDKSFINGVNHDSQDAAIAEMITKMGHILKLRVVAEGVETEEQLAFLKRCECDEYQGYYYSKPLTEGDFTNLLTRCFSSNLQ